MYGVRKPLWAIGYQLLWGSMKIAVLLSGGVDSSVALCLLKEEGHDLTAFLPQGVARRRARLSRRVPVGGRPRARPRGLRSLRRSARSALVAKGILGSRRAVHDRRAARRPHPEPRYFLQPADQIRRILRRDRRELRARRDGALCAARARKRFCPSQKGRRSGQGPNLFLVAHVSGTAEARIVSDWRAPKVRSTPARRRARLAESGA